MKEWAKAFYNGKPWRKTREHIFERDNGLCVRCLAKKIITPGEIVHHKEYLTPENINDPDIAYGDDNLELLCRECHAIEHEGELPTDSALQFDKFGNLVERKTHHEREDM